MSDEEWNVGLLTELKRRLGIVDPAPRKVYKPMITAEDVGRESVPAKPRTYGKRNFSRAKAERERARMTPSLRYKVLERDGFKCCACHRSGVVLHVDHIKPVSKGGKTELDNLQALCVDCNRGKGAKP